MSYAAQTEWMEADELKAFVRDLPRKPGERPTGVSRGVGDLMRAMQGRPGVSTARSDA